MSFCKTYYAIYRKSPTQENPWNLSLIVITENPQAVGEFVSPAAQNSAINIQLDADDENPNLSYCWYNNNNRLVMKICVNPYRFRAIYFAKTHHDKTLEVIFDNKEMEQWFDDVYHNHVAEDIEHYYNDFSNRVINGNETEYKVQRSSRSVQYTLHKVQFPIGVMT
jgi:hypothetical protein